MCTDKWTCRTIEIKYQGVKVTQLEEARAVDHAVGRSSTGCAKLLKSLQQASNPKLLSLSNQIETKTWRTRVPQYHHRHVKDTPLPFTHTLGKC